MATCLRLHFVVPPRCHSEKSAIGKKGPFTPQNATNELNAKKHVNAPPRYFLVLVCAKKKQTHAFRAEVKMAAVSGTDFSRMDHLRASFLSARRTRATTCFVRLFLRERPLEFNRFVFV